MFTPNETSTGADFGQAMMFTDLALLLTTFTLNCCLLVIFYTSKLNCSEMANILIFSSALMDNVCVIVYLFSDSMIPLYSIFNLSVLPFLCKFRRYAIQVRLTGRSLLLATLLRQPRPKPSMSPSNAVNQISCGIFIFPALVWFMALSCNIWTVVLYECKMVNCWLNPSASHNQSLMAINIPLSLLDTNINSVRLGIIVHASLTIGLPLLLCLLFLMQRLVHSNTRSLPSPTTGTLKKSSLKLACTFLLATLVLSCPDQLSNLYLVHQSRGTNNTITGEMVLIVVVSQMLMYLELVLKPFLCLTSHKIIRKTIEKSMRKLFSRKPKTLDSPQDVQLEFLSNESRDQYIEESSTERVG